MHHTKAVDRAAKPFRTLESIMQKEQAAAAPAAGATVNDSAPQNAEADEGQPIELPEGAEDDLVEQIESAIVTPNEPMDLPQEMSTNLLVSTGSNLPSPGGQGDEQLGTGVFAQLNIVHVKYRGFFVERFQCCCHPLREYAVKPCVRDFGEIPTDHEFDNGEVTLVMDDCNPGTRCLCLPGYYKRLTITAKDRNSKLSFTLERPSTCPIACLPWPFNCMILCPLKVFVRGSTGGVLGYAQQVTKCCNCSGFIEVLDASNQVMYTIQEPCCQGCAFSCCLPNLCCKRNRLSIHPANSHDTVGEIVHTFPGCSKSCCTSSSNFFVAFPPGATPDQKAMVMAAAFLANYLYFRSAL
ncbi:hypothetical protein WJX82_000208 [Trebouxia sp. C0006]